MFKHDVVVQGEIRDTKIIMDCVFREKDACSRLHITGDERKRRIEAVYQKGMAEEARVQATRYRSAFRVPQTD